MTNPGISLRFPARGNFAASRASKIAVLGPDFRFINYLFYGCQDCPDFYFMFSDNNRGGLYRKIAAADFSIQRRFGKHLGSSS